jgi:hypothetical protein
MSSKLSPSATVKVTSEPSFSTKVTLRSWPGLGGVRWAWARVGVVEKARSVGVSVLRVLGRVYCDRRAD